MNILLLIIKDLRANWMLQLFSLAILFAISAGFVTIWLKGWTTSDPIESFVSLATAFYVIAVVLSSKLASLLFMKMDEIYGTGEIFASLPVTRSQIVFAKYATSFVQVLLGLSIHILAILIIVYFLVGLDHPAVGIIFNPMLWLLMLVLLLLSNSFSFPFYFRFGLTRGIAVVGIIQFLLIVVAVLTYKMLNPGDYIQDTLEWLSNQNRLLLQTGLIGFFLFILSGSMALSARLYHNKEL